MFKFIKKVKQSLQDPNEVIEKIHYEFDSASERLLKEAKEIIARNKDADKGERLKKIGFGSAAPVVQSEENKQKEKLANQIEYYQTWYPNNKFITESEVKRICEKYGLLFGESRQYKGDIPEKNLIEIENFKLRDEEKIKRTNYDDYQEHYFTTQRFGGLGQSILGAPRQTQIEYNPPKEIRTYLSTPSFKICAPEKDFDTRYMTVVDGYKLQYDPIVMQPVKDGYLIVSKWGLEGQDENLINEKMN